MNTTLDIILQAQNKASPGIDDVNRALKNLGSSATNLNDHALTPLRNALQTGFKIAAGAATAAIVGLTATIASSVSASADMEQKLQDIRASMGASAEETAKLKKLIGDLGFDPKLKVTAVEAAEAIQTLGTAGLSVDEILGGAARSTVLLANATGVDLAGAAAIATDTMALFGVQADNMGSAIDGIVSTTINSKFGINDYRLALAQAGGMAAAVGVEFDDFNATIASIAPYFASGSDAGTSFKTFLQRLIPSSNEARDAMRDLGLFTGLSKKEFETAQAKIQEYNAKLAALDPTSKHFAERSEELKAKIQALQSTLETGKNAFYDANGNLKSMAEITGILNTAVSGLSEEEKNAALSVIFGSDAMRAAIAISDKNTESFNQLKATMAKTDAIESAATRMDSFSGVMEILWGVVDALKLQIGDAFLPVLRKLAEQMTETITNQGPKLVDVFKKLAENVGIALDRFLPWVIDMIPRMIEQLPVVIDSITRFAVEFYNIASAVITAISPILQWIAQVDNLKYILGAFAVLTGVQVVASIYSFVSAVVGVVGALGGVLAAINPVVLIIGVLGAAIYGLYVAWQNNFLGIRDITATAFEAIKGWISDLPGAMASAGQAIQGWFQTIRGWFSELPSTLAPATEAMKSWGQAAMTKLQEGFAIASAPVKAELQRIVQDVSENGVIYAIGAHAGRMYEAARGAMLRFVQGFREASPNLVGDIQGLLGGIIDVVNAFSAGGAGHLFVKAKEIMGRFAEGFKGVDVVGAFNETNRRIIDFINSWAPGAGNHLFTKASEVVNRFRQAFLNIDVGQAFQNGLSGIVNFVNSWAPGTGNHLFAKAGEVINRMKEGFTVGDLAGSLRNSLGGIVDAVNNWSNQSREHVFLKAKEYGIRMMEGLRDGINQAWSAVLQSIQNISVSLPQWIKDQLGIHSPSTVFADIGNSIMQGLAQGIQAATNLPELAMADAAGNIVNNTVSSVTNRQDQRQFTFNIQQTSAGQDSTDTINSLRALYGSKR